MYRNHQNLFRVVTTKTSRRLLLPFSYEKLFLFIQVLPNVIFGSVVKFEVVFIEELISSIVTRPINLGITVNLILYLLNSSGSFCDFVKGLLVAFT